MENQTDTGATLLQPRLVRQAFDALSDDISDRRGLKWEWTKVDDDVMQNEIRPAWEEIISECVRKHLESPAAFPVNPERDEKGNAVLYPGMVRYEGVAAIFGTADTDQFVILAPTVEGLKRALSDHDITNALNVGACRIATLESLPNT